jgi:hypothetical protein
MKTAKSNGVAVARKANIIPLENPDAEIAAWLQSCPKGYDGQSEVSIPVTITMSFAAWQAHVQSTSARQMTLGELLSLILDHESTEFENRGYRTVVESGPDESERLREGAQ